MAMIVAESSTGPERLTSTKDGGKQRLDVNADAMVVPSHDAMIMDETDPDNVVITYKLAGVLVATKTVAVSGAITTVTITLP
jgi:hypothetical protein